jgi:hypothetical protein
MNGDQEEEEEEEELRRFEKLRRDLEAFERWNMLPRWKREWFGELTREDVEGIDRLLALVPQIPDIQKAVKIARGAETASRFWKKGLLAFFGGILVIGPAIKMLKEMWEWLASLRGGPP